MKTTSVEEMKNDYGWQHAFYEAMYGDCKPWDDNIGPISQVVSVIAADEGENDGPDWIAVVEWSGPEGKYAVMRAGCDYTGWDCQAGGKMEYYDTEEEASSVLTLTQEERERLGIV